MQGVVLGIATVKRGCRHHTAFCCTFFNSSCCVFLKFHPKIHRTRLVSGWYFVGLCVGGGPSKTQPRAVVRPWLLDRPVGIVDKYGRPPDLARTRTVVSCDNRVDVVVVVTLAAGTSSSLLLPRARLVDPVFGKRPWP